MKVEEVKKDQPEDAFVITVREIIEQHISTFDFNVEQLASDLHLSQSQLGRKMEALIGYTPGRYIRLIRLKKAQHLLLDPDLSITAIAFDCGFSDPSYFTRVFKKAFGQTPGEWRNEVALQSG